MTVFELARATSEGGEFSVTPPDWVFSSGEVPDFELGESFFDEVDEDGEE